jgi:uncharacterized NAD(P)/FAD-binding protein YdhS
VLRRETDALPPDALCTEKADLEHMTDNACRIAVIGAGFSGVLVTLHLIAPADDGLLASCRPRGSAASRQLQVQRIINCSGPETDYERVGDPLVAQLIKDGLARPDLYRLGLDASAQGAVIGGDGQPSRRLFGAGPMVRGTLWELVSVAEIRSQAEQVAIASLDAARKAASGVAKRA